MFGRLKTDKAQTRSIDGMRDGQNRTSAGEVMLDAQDLPWMDLEKEDERLVDAEKRRAMAIQDKIIAFFEIDTKSLVTAQEIVGLAPRALKDLKRKRLGELRRMTLDTEDPQIGSEQREEFLQKIRDGRITALDETNFLLLIPGPMDEAEIGAEKMFDKISADPRQIQILAVAAGYNLKNWQKVDKEALRRMLGAVQANGVDYRTPVGFVKLKKYFLEGIRKKAKEQVFQCYVQSIMELERTLYGERLEYYRQFEVLKKEAREAKADEMRMASVAGAESALRQEPAVREMRDKFERLSSERGAEMLGRAMIEGDAWRGSGREEYLSTHSLAEAKLSPLYEVKVGETEVCLSALYQLPDGRAGAVAYAPMGQSWKVRSYYKNPQLGLWCYLPEYTRKQDGTMENLGVGYGLSSVILPHELQVALMQIEKKFGLTNVAGAEFVFAGTAQAYDSIQEYQVLSAQGKVRGDYYLEMSREALNQGFGGYGGGRKKAPYTLGIDYGKAPDFGQRRMHLVTSTADAGTTEVEGFSSHDGQLVWVFANDSKGRTWIAHVEAVAPITSLGLRRDFMVMGDFVTPLYEYTSNAGIYGDRDDTRGPRQCMWKNYLSNVPMIQEYRAQRG